MSLAAERISSDTTVIANRIKEIRTTRKITQQQLADQALLPYSYMSELGNGKHNMKADMLARVMQIVVALLQLFG